MQGLVNSWGRREVMLETWLVWGPAREAPWASDACRPFPGGSQRGRAPGAITHPLPRAWGGRVLKSP